MLDFCNRILCAYRFLLADVQSTESRQSRKANWIEQTFSKRTCARFIGAAKRVDDRCSCGRGRSSHDAQVIADDDETAETWKPAKHTATGPTDAYGSIDFVGAAVSHRPVNNRAHFVRLSYDTPPEAVFQLLAREWRLETPKLVVSIHGGKSDFELSPPLKRVLREGLLRVAKTTGK